MGSKGVLLRWRAEELQALGHRTKKTLEIDPIQAETVRLIFRLAREGNGSSGANGRQIDCQTSE